ncbi:hypothetical protein ACQUSR_26080 [Streptomyces sp. P1-3]|uniref:hypothetical protein n=1 Tax=Streptomyces sp. P1-3 TaxID=3421658 RepID=UPI003D364BCB
MTPRPTALRPALRAVAIAACLPYVALKAAWICGSRVGIPEGSALRDAGVGLALINAATLLMDGAVVVLALLLTQPWGRRVPAWLLALPMWGATGLLAPIMTGFPLQLLIRALGGSTRKDADDAEPFLDEWVYGVVYGGFIVQGLALGTLFVLYARDRWAPLWRGRLGELPEGATGPAYRVVAVVTALLALLPVVMHLMWASGVTAGLGEQQAKEHTSDIACLDAVYALFTAAAAAGVLMVAFRWGRRVPLRVPLALGWLGSGAPACWGGWMTLAALGVAPDDPKAPSQVVDLTYAVQMIIGGLLVAVGAFFFAERAGQLASSRTAGPAPQHARGLVAVRADRRAAR